MSGTSTNDWFEDSSAATDFPSIEFSRPNSDDCLIVPWLWCPFDFQWEIIQPRLQEPPRIKGKLIKPYRRQMRKRINRRLKNEYAGKRF